MGLPRATVRRTLPEGHREVPVAWRWKLILLPGFFIVDTDRLVREPNNYECSNRLDLARRNDSRYILLLALFVFPSTSRRAGLRKDTRDNGGTVDTSDTREYANPGKDEALFSVSMLPRCLGYNSAKKSYCGN